MHIAAVVTHHIDVRSHFLVESLAEGNLGADLVFESVVEALMAESLGPMVAGKLLRKS